MLFAGCFAPQTAMRWRRPVSEERLRVGDVAARTGLSEHTIRRFTADHLIGGPGHPPPRERCGQLSEELDQAETFAQLLRAHITCAREEM